MSSLVFLDDKDKKPKLESIEIYSGSGEIKLEPFDPLDHLDLPSTSAIDDDNPKGTSSEPVAKKRKNTNLNKEVVKVMWNMERIILDLQTEDQCVRFCEDVGLLPKTKKCRKHRTFCNIRNDRKNACGFFVCDKTTCRKRWARATGTWFEKCKLPIPTVFRIMYCFARDYYYYNTHIECFSRNRELVISDSTICTWFNCCRETIVTYELDHMEKRGKIGGEGKAVIVDESTFGDRKFEKGREREGYWVITMFDPCSNDLRIATCPVSEAFVEVQIPIIKHVEPNSIVYTSTWPAYEGLEYHGFKHKLLTGKDANIASALEANVVTAPEATASKPNVSTASEANVSTASKANVSTAPEEKVSTAPEANMNKMSNWRFLKKRFNKLHFTGNFEDILIEIMWRQSIRRNNLDPFDELIKAIKYVYKV